MVIKRVFRILPIVTFLVVLFAFTALGYSYDIYGCVTGLDEGKEYTAANYDIISENGAANQPSQMKRSSHREYGVSPKRTATPRSSLSVTIRAVC